MNSISHAGASHEFSTVDELLALPMVAKFLNDPQFKYWAYDGLTIYAVDRTPIMHLVGIVKERVVLPLKLQASQPANHLGESK